MNKKGCKGKGINWAISEVAFFAFLYYAQSLLNVRGNLIVSSLILWILINVSIIFCPVLNKFCNNEKGKSRKK